MLITNLPHISGYDIEMTHGMVSTTVSLTRRVMKSSMGGARVAHESGCDGFSAELEAARKQAFKELEKQAQKLEATAVIGVAENLQRIGENGFMLLLSGTAVDLVKAPPVAVAATQGPAQQHIVYVQAEQFEPEIVKATVRDNVIYPQFVRG